jgi:uncharacterized protein (DUF2062 family)
MVQAFVLMLFSSKSLAIDFKKKVLDCVIGRNPRRRTDPVRLTRIPPSSLAKIFFLEPIERAGVTALKVHGQMMIDKDRFFEFFKKGYKRFLKIRGQPREIALGFALGLFIGMTPAIGFHTAMAVFFAAVLRWNKLSAAVGVWISNPFTAPILYGITYVAGAKVLGLGHASGSEHEVGAASLEGLLSKAPEILWALLIGGALIGLPVALAGYYASYFAVVRYQEKIRRRIERQRERLARKKAALKSRKKSRENGLMKV